MGQGAGVKSLDLNQLEAIITGKTKNWKDVGGADANIFSLGREKTEAILTVLRSTYSFFDNAQFSKLVKKDHQVVSFLTKDPKGKAAIAFGAKPNFDGESQINQIEVKDFSVGVSVGLVYDLKNSENSLVKTAEKYAQSEDWAKIITTAGYLPPQ